MLVYMPLIVALVTIGVILYFTITSRGGNNIMDKMMESQMELMKDMTSGDIGEKLKDLSQTAINVRKNILEENEETLKEMADMEANIEKNAIKTKAQAVKEGFSSNKTMFCKHCGENIDADSVFCKVCGKKQ